MFLGGRLYIIEVEDACVFGAHSGDHVGCDLVFAFTTKEDASDYVSDLLRYWPGEVKVPSFTSKTLEELRQMTEDRGIYPYPSPVLEIIYTEEDSFIPSIVEKKDVAHSVKR
jgi:hypothetical protein